ncbi:MAG: L,D-transpeptidase family protein [Hyphomicrobiaceae bacterium]|nr:L,D-transpeptidase family protein [Hyphomicrobiaceae bacterium]
MLRPRPRLFAVVGLLPMVLGTDAGQAPSAEAHTPASLAKSGPPPLTARSASEKVADIPGVTYPRSAPPDLVAPDLPRESEEAGPRAEPQAEPEPAIVPASEPAPAPPLKTETPVVSLRLEVDLAEQRLTIIEGEETRHVWPISSGRAGYATKTGTFRPKWASRMWYSRQYDLAPMPHAVFFNGGTAFHATSATHLLGRPASHGCIRLAPQNARLLYGLVHRHGYAKTEIRVFGSAKVAGPATRKGRGIAERRPRAPENASNSPFGAWPFF